MRHCWRVGSIELEMPPLAGIVAKALAFENAQEPIAIGTRGCGDALVESRAQLREAVERGSKIETRFRCARLERSIAPAPIGRCRLLWLVGANKANIDGDAKRMPRISSDVAEREEASLVEIGIEHGFEPIFPGGLRPSSECSHCAGGPVAIVHFQKKAFRHELGLRAGKRLCRRPPKDAAGRLVAWDAPPSEVERAGVADVLTNGRRNLVKSSEARRRRVLLAAYTRRAGKDKRDSERPRLHLTPRSSASKRPSTLQQP